MPFRSSSEIRYFEFGIFTQGVLHAIFTRRGGVSPAPWSGLNLGGTVGDNPERVKENRRRIFTAIDRDPASIFDVWQVHGVETVFAEAPRPPQETYRQADIVLTDQPGVTILMRFADCVPVLFHDPIKNVVGIAHAGWLGTVRGVVRKAIRDMQSHYGSSPADIRVAIGPSIGPDHYEVGSDVINKVRHYFGPASDEFLTVRLGSTYFDLWLANKRMAEEIGVEHIEVAGICTACHTEDWFSHRAEKGRTGRFGAIIALNP
jgi:YfiH family protein